MNLNLSPYDSARFFAIWDAFYFTLTNIQNERCMRPCTVLLLIKVPFYKAQVQMQ